MSRVVYHSLNSQAHQEYQEYFTQSRVSRVSRGTSHSQEYLEHIRLLLLQREMEESEYTISLADLTSGFRKELFTSERFGDTFVALIRTQYLTSTNASTLTREEPLAEEYIAVPLPASYLDYKLFQSNGVSTTLSDLVSLDIPFYLDPASPSDDTDLLEDVYVVNVPVGLDVVHMLLIATQPILGPLAQSLDILEALHTANAEEMYQPVLDRAVDNFKEAARRERKRSATEMILPCLDECGEVSDLEFTWTSVKSLPRASLSRLVSSYTKLVKNRTLAVIVADEESSVSRLINDEVQSYIDQVPVAGNELWIGQPRIPSGSFKSWTGINKIEKAWSRGFLLLNTFIVGEVLTGMMEAAGGRAHTLPRFSVTAETAASIVEFQKYLDATEDRLSEFTLEQYEGQAYFEAHFTSGKSFEGSFSLVWKKLEFVVETIDEVELERATQKVRELLERRYDPMEFEVAADLIYLHSSSMLVSVRMGSRYDSLRSPFPLERGYIGPQGLRGTKTREEAQFGKRWLFYPDNQLVDSPYPPKYSGLNRANLSESDQAKLLERASGPRGDVLITFISSLFQILPQAATGEIVWSVVDQFYNGGYQYNLEDDSATGYAIDEVPSWYRA